VLFKTRKVRQSKFSSRIRSDVRSRREYAATVYSTAFIQGLLACALVVAAIRSYQAVSVHAGVPLIMRLALPIVFAIGALLMGRAAARNVASARAMPVQRASRDTDDTSPPRH